MRGLIDGIEENGADAPIDPFSVEFAGHMRGELEELNGNEAGEVPLPKALETGETDVNGDAGQVVLRVPFTYPEPIVAGEVAFSVGFAGHIGRGLEGLNRPDAGEVPLPKALLTLEEGGNRRRGPEFAGQVLLTLPLTKPEAIVAAAAETGEIYPIITPANTATFKTVPRWGTLKEGDLAEA